MLLNVCGKLIVLDYIYEISEIKQCYPPVEYYISYGFNINFLNEKSININLSTSKFKNEYQNILEEKINEAISKYWHMGNDRPSNWKTTQQQEREKVIDDVVGPFVNKVMDEVTRVRNLVIENLQLYNENKISPIKEINWNF